MLNTAKKPDPRAAKTGKDHTESNSGKAKADEGRARSKKRTVAAFTRLADGTSRPYPPRGHGDAEKREEIEMFHVARPTVPLTDQAVDHDPPLPIASGLERASHQEDTNLPSEEMVPSIRELLATPPAVGNDMRGQQVGWQYNAGRDINITNVHSWDGLAEQIDKIQTEIENASRYEIISADRAEAIQTQLAAIRVEMHQADCNQQAILADLYNVQSHVGAASRELAQKVEECSQKIERLQQLAQSGTSYGQTKQQRIVQAISEQRTTRTVLLAGVTGLVALAFDLGLTGGLVSALPALMVVGQSALTLLTNSQTTVACSACGSLVHVG